MTFVAGSGGGVGVGVGSCGGCSSRRSWCRASNVSMINGELIGI